MGTTNSLIQKDPEREWVAANNPEFNIETEDSNLSPMELGDTDFSDTSNELGATLTLIKSGQDLVYTVQTIAFHDKPVMLRKVSLANVGESPIYIKSITLDSFELDSNETSFLTQFFKKESSSVISDSEETTVALTWGADGLLLGRMGEAYFDLGYRDSRVCQIVSNVNHSINPGESLTYDQTVIMPYNGSPLDYANKHIPEVMKQLKAFEMSEHKKAKELKEEEPT
jgi:hypothetical protein